MKSLGNGTSLLRRATCAFITATAIMCAGATAEAGSVTYAYTGNEFTEAVGTPGLPSSAAISFTLTLSSAFASDLNYSVLSDVVSWSVTDGTNTVSSSDAGSTGFFSFSTDALGNITTWEAEGYDSSFFLAALSPVTPNDFYFGTPYTVADASINDSQRSMAYNTTPGSWTESSAAPEPGSLLLLLGGAAVLWGVRRAARRASGERQSA